jgi:hypothetical protein
MDSSLGGMFARFRARRFTTAIQTAEIQDPSTSPTLLISTRHESALLGLLPQLARTPGRVGRRGAAT